MLSDECRPCILVNRPWGPVETKVLELEERLERERKDDLNENQEWYSK